MRVKCFKKLVSVVLAVTMLMLCIPSALAVTTESANSLLEEELAEGYEFGAVLVSLNPGAPSIRSLLVDFEISESRLITPGSSTQNVYHVKFVEKTKEIVWRAIEVLNASPYVKCADPNYYRGFGVMPTTNSSETTEPTTHASSTTQPITEAEDPSIGLIKGDADGDGNVSIIDATTIQRYLVGLCEINDEQLSVADTDKDGCVSIRDVTIIQRYLVGLVSNW